jgi:hypothetical protein
MSLKRARPSDPRRFDAGWPTMQRAPFVESQAYRVLADELGRYLNEGVRGRSFLIAGPRGAGKTAMVRQVAEALHLQVFSRAAETAPLPGQAVPRRRNQIQRPLFVQIYGPSLLSTKPPAPAKTADGKDADPPPADDKGRDALVQITIALYRAVATEFADSFAVQAAAAAPPRRRDLLEAAAQLRLDLDMSPNPARLREQWQALGRLGDGVLWPDLIAAAGPEDQGVREIVAVATAAQAFKVCAGKVTRTETEKENASRTASIEAKGETGLKEFGDKLLGLASGLGVGFGAAGTLGNFGAAAAGVATALLCGATLSWASKRSLLSDRSVDYSFLPDSNVETLDRDLPLVIRRLRDVGLAPVFVVDELDKVDPNTIGMDIGTLIGRLKLLLTDHGFFCFLTDRSYYETVQRQADAWNFSAAHTYFNARLFVGYSPRDLAAFVNRIVVPGDVADTSDTLARLLLTRQILHRSELNFIALARELAKNWDDGGLLASSSAQISGSPQYQVPAVVQLAIELALRTDGLKARVAQDPAFAQVAADALYLISRAWRDDCETVSVARAQIVTRLLNRMELLPADNDAASEAWLLTRITKAELDTVVRGVQELARLLCDFGALRSALEADDGFSPEDRVVLPVFAVLPGPGLLQRLDATTYRFRIDKYGIGLVAAGGAAASAGGTAPVRDEVEGLLAYLSAFVDALDEIGIDLPGLARAKALPATLNWADMKAALSRLHASIDSGAWSEAADGDLQLVRGCQTLILQRSAPLALALLLANFVRHQAAELEGRVAPWGLEPTLSCFARHIGAPWNSMALGTEEPDPALTSILTRLLLLTEALPVYAPSLDTAATIAAWRAAVTGPAILNRPPGAKLWFDQKIAWSSWTEFVLAVVLVSAPARREPRLEDLVGAAAHRLPSRLFRRDLAEFQPWDWTMLALEGAMTAAGVRDEAPLWALLAGLRALGVDGGKMAELRGLFPAISAAIGSPEPVLARLLEGAPRAATAILNVVADLNLAEPVANTDTPMLWIDLGSLRDYSPALSWLESNGVFDEVRREQ